MAREQRGVGGIADVCRAVRIGVDLAAGEPRLVRQRLLAVDRPAPDNAVVFAIADQVTGSAVELGRQQQPVILRVVGGRAHRHRALAEVGCGQRDAGRPHRRLADRPERLHEAHGLLDVDLDVQDRRGRALPAGDRVVADEPALASPDPGSPGDAAMAPRRDVLPVPELGEVADAEHTHRQIGDADVAGTEEAHDQQEIAPPAERRVAPHEVDGRVVQPGRGLVAAGLDAEHHSGSHRVGSFGHDART
jgi:hypothetical protein